MLHHRFEPPHSQQLNILGIRGIPAAHGGFETFAADLAPYVLAQGWKVVAYCQDKEGVPRPKSFVDEWRGIVRVHIPTYFKGPLGTIEFDIRCLFHVLNQPGQDLVLGYNTAVLTLFQRLRGRHVTMNMDGIEWSRKKWGSVAKVWLWMNEWIGARLCSVPVADHPEIKAHLARRGCDRAVFIPYGSVAITRGDVAPLSALGVKPRDYFISIARIEPENSILEIVEAFGLAQTGRKLVFLGRLDPETNPYHARVMAAATPDVIFAGAIYDQAIVKALRFHALAYLHGHQVGGTNPSLVEALGAGSIVIAHDNRFNRWTAGEKQFFFGSAKACAEAMQVVAAEDDRSLFLRQYSRDLHAQKYDLDNINGQYFAVFAKAASTLRVDAAQALAV